MTVVVVAVVEPLPPCRHLLHSVARHHHLSVQILAKTKTRTTAQLLPSAATLASTARPNRLHVQHIMCFMLYSRAFTRLSPSPLHRNARALWCVFGAEFWSSMRFWVLQTRARFNQRLIDRHCSDLCVWCVCCSSSYGVMLWIWVTLLEIFVTRNCVES